jgi:hypothetical protein
MEIIQIILLAFCFLLAGAWLFYEYRHDRSLAWAVHAYLVVAGGVVGVVIALVVAFAWYGVPFTTSGVHEIGWGVLPIAGGFGSLSVFLLIHRAARRRAHKQGQHPTNGLSQ